MSTLACCMWHVQLRWLSVVCFLLVYFLPSAISDNGQLRQRDGYISELKNKFIPIHKAKAIETRKDAEVYLRHYGYLNCSEEPGRRKRQLLPEGLIEGGDDGPELDPCDENDYVEALVFFQQKRNITVTGILDEATKEEMMAGRCGNPDPVKIKEPVRKSSENDINDKLDISKVPSKRIKRDTLGSHVVVKSKSSQSRLRRWIGSWMGEEVEVEEWVDEAGDVVDTVHWHMVPEGIHDRAEQHSLLSIIFNPHKHKKRKATRREEMFEEIKQKIETNMRTKRDVSDQSELDNNVEFGVERDSYSRQSRQKRAQSFGPQMDHADESSNHRWNNKKILTYRVLDGGFSQKIPLIDQCGTVALAFRMWAEVTNLDFRPSPSKNKLDDTDIYIAFGKGQHLDCDDSFDGEGGEIAHSKTKEGHSSFHIDEEENFKAYPKNKADGIPLLLTVIHEIGHVLGLDHLFSSKSVMYPTLVQEFYSTDFELTPDDREAIQDIYGKCTGRFNAMFDWLHTDPNRDRGLRCMQPCECDNQYWQYYSYVFRDEMYWLYLNSEQRPRYGDPLSISLKWKNLPSRIDAVVQITRELKNVCGKKTQFELETIFFSGEQYYVYDDIDDRVQTVNNISGRFGPLPGQSTSIPSYLDAVLFDPRDNFLHFFKDDWVGVVDPFIDNPENGSCCVTQYNFTDYFQFNATEYREQHNDTEVPELNGYIDTVYLRYSERSIYFFKNEFVYMADIKHPRRHWAKPGPVKLEFLGKWNQFWNYLCDVHTSEIDYCTASNLRNP